MNNLTTEAEARAESARVSRGGKTRVFTRVTCPSAFSPFMRNAGRRVGWGGLHCARRGGGRAPRGTTLQPARVSVALCGERRKKRTGIIHDAAWGGRAKRVTLGELVDK